VLLLMLVVLAVVPSKQHETGAPGLFVAVRPMMHRANDGATGSTPPCEDQPNGEDAFAVHARAYPARDVEEC
jgi:hypothetical protein